MAIAVAACGGRALPGEQEPGSETPSSPSQDPVAPTGGTDSTFGTTGTCSPNPPPNARCVFCHTGYLVQDGQVTCECCTPCASDPIINMPCPSHYPQCPLGYLTSGDFCACCEARIEVAYHTSGGKYGGYRQLTISSKKAWLAKDQVMGTPCGFTLSEEVLGELLRLYRAVDLAAVKPDFSPDNPTGCCDQIVHKLKISYGDTLALSMLETRYLSEDFGENGDLPEALQDLDAHLDAVIKAALAGPCEML